MIENYEKYLDLLAPYLQKYFDQQKPYIHCKEGCSICCETGLYPLSNLEFDYMMIGLNSLPKKEKQQIYKSIEQIKIDRQNITDGIGYYKCPFLLDKKCSVYRYRSIICRTYGLMHFWEDKDNNQRFNIPCCVSDGLNYSEVYDEERGTISAQKYAQSGIEAEPLSYNLGLKYLLSCEFAKDLKLEFGENKSLIDWFN